jgi:diguanylate cyclase (GGDEF)-like protein/PAS domain S-box-containing protein
LDRGAVAWASRIAADPATGDAASSLLDVCHVMSDVGFRAIFEGALDPMLLADDDARYVDANPAACAFFGLCHAELCTLGVVDFTPEDARAEFSAVWNLFLHEEKQRGEYALQMLDGRICEIEFSATANVWPGRHLSIIRDITERKRLEAERERLIAVANDLARTDSLTGLPNRRVWNDRIVDEVHHAKRSNDPLTIALIDLDDFKVLNDTQGHPAGDKLLQTVAAAWQKQLRDIDLLVRGGGDEFWLLFPACPPGLEHAVLQRMRTAMPPGQTFSAGTATWDRTEGVTELLERADRALYEDKLGRGVRPPSRSSPGS